MRSQKLVVVAAAVLLVLGMAGSAGAAAAKKGPPPLCNLIVGDAEGQPSALAPGSVFHSLPLPYSALPVHDPALLIKSADVANDAKTVTVVFRMANLASKSAAPTGRLYQFGWVWASSGIHSAMWARVGGPQGNAAQAGSRVVVDLAKNEIRIHQTIDLLGGHPTFAKGDRMTQLLALTDLAFPADLVSNAAVPSYAGLAPTQGLYGHRAGTTKNYPLFAPSCVKVGV